MCMRGEKCRRRFSFCCSSLVPAGFYSEWIPGECCRNNSPILQLGRFGVFSGNSIPSQILRDSADTLLMIIND